MTLEIDQREFHAALKQYIAVTRHSIAYALNKKAFFIAREAAKDTPVATREAIQSVFNVSQTEKVNKKGKTIRKINFSDMNSSAYALLQWHQKKKGKPPVPRSEVKKAAQRFVANRLRAVGSLKSGWKRTVLILQRAVKESWGFDSSANVKQQGFAKPATEGFSPDVTFGYRVTEKKKGTKRIDPRVVAALQAAFNAETANMKQYLESYLQKDADKVNAK